MSCWGFASDPRWKSLRRSPDLRCMVERGRDPIPALPRSLNAQSERSPFVFSANWRLSVVMLALKNCGTLAILEGGEGGEATLGNTVAVEPGIVQYTAEYRPHKRAASSSTAFPMSTDWWIRSINRILTVCGRRICPRQLSVCLLLLTYFLN